MPDIRIAEPHQLPVDDVKGRLSAFEALLGKYGVRLQWEGNRAKFVGVPGVGGHVDVRPSEVDVHVHVSRLLTAMGLDPTKLEATIRRRLTDALKT